MRGRPGRQTTQIPEDGFVTLHIGDLRAQVQEYWAQQPPNTSLAQVLRELIQMALSLDPASEAIFIERRRAYRAFQRHMYRSIGPMLEILLHDLKNTTIVLEEDEENG